MPDRTWITMSFSAPLFFRYHLPLTLFQVSSLGCHEGNFPFLQPFRPGILSNFIQHCLICQFYRFIDWILVVQKFFDEPRNIGFGNFCHFIRGNSGFVYVFFASSEKFPFPELTVSPFFDFFFFKHTVYHLIYFIHFRYIAHLWVSNNASFKSYLLYLMLKTG